MYIYFFQDIPEAEFRIASFEWRCVHKTLKTRLS